MAGKCNAHERDRERDEIFIKNLGQTWKDIAI
jgi:hypothetical protein